MAGEGRREKLSAAAAQVFHLKATGGMTRHKNQECPLKQLLVLTSLITFLMLSGSVSIVDAGSSPGQSLQTSTWTIVAIDEKNGDVGVAGASCVPNTYVDAVAALVPGKGAAATQAGFAMENRNRVFLLLQEGYSADEIIRQAINPNADSQIEHRQYGVITMSNGSVEAEAFTGSENPDWSGSQQDIGMGVTVQGNFLVSEAVVTNAMEAFRSESNSGENSLPDRLMRALEAGSAAGGDARCNNDQVEQTASTAFILVARGDQEPYAARAIGITDMGTTEAPWLALSVKESRFGPNPIIELRNRYEVWRDENLINENTFAIHPLAYIAAALVLLVVVALARRSMKQEQVQNSSENS